MERPIKFRAWDKRGKQMILTISQLHLESGMIVGHCGKDETWVLNDKNQYTIMQYTGLLDKNGKEVYEEDFLKLSHEYDQTEDDFHLHDFVDDTCYLRMFDKESIEIIGNVYEHKELISPKTDSTPDCT